jgi:hypothetical protein
MSEPLTLELSEQAFAVLRRQAEAAGTSPARLAAASLERQFGNTEAIQDESARQAARERFERHFGEIKQGGAMDADNERIDADLAGEYADTHEKG